MTQKEAARLSQITAQHYNFIETDRRTPSVDTAKRIASALHCDWVRFFEEGEQ